MNTKKVLVTGAGGFIGSHLAEALCESGASVRALVRYNSRNHWGWLEQSELKDSIEIVSGDVRDFDSVQKALRGCDTVFHLAALIGIPYSYVSPLAYVRTNIEGTYNILEASGQLGLSSILITSTSETYGTAQKVPIDENHPLVGQSPYAASKIAADQLAISYHRSFGLPVKIVRPFNTYGPRQSLRAIIPTIVAQVLAGKSMVAVGNVNPTRDLTYVRDTTAAFLAIAQAKDLIGEVTHIGMNQEISIRELIDLIAGVMDRPISYVSEEQRRRPDTSEVQRLRCDNSKIIQHTSWRPRYSLRQGVEATVTWIEKNMPSLKARLYNI